MSVKKLYFDLYIEGNVTRNFFLDRVLVKSVSTLKNGPPMFFNEEHIAIKHYLLIGQWIKSERSSSQNTGS